MKRFLIFIVASACLFLPLASLSAMDYAPIQISLVPGISIPWASSAGIAVGAIGNISGRVDFIQAAGVFNIADRMNGLQAAGVFNIAGGSQTPLQVAGVFNIGADVAGIQSAGVFNIAEDVAGAQVSGVFNIANEVQGFQIGPIFNIADDVEGMQVGLVNVADHVDGLQLGLVNISSNGVFDIDAVWEPDTDFGRALMKTGNTSAFAVFSVAQPKDEIFQLSDNTIVSAGLGTRLGDARGLFLDFTLSASQLVGADFERFLEGCTYSHGLEPVDVLEPWPTIDASLSLNLGGLRLIGGMRSEIRLASAPYLPLQLEKGFEYSDTWFGESFTAWSRWYVGLGF
ncbi:MAG: hypothetical protein CVV27_19810 [Candidatus Melainabacteria bacterium HGW-Melainabacteria-1]|nr:MAG: hypothetical protein CVV27_19810 [Candidatus Melainabacteria bacterium HGW-Melainabacteria-1]